MSGSPADTAEAVPPPDARTPARIDRTVLLLLVFPLLALVLLWDVLLGGKVLLPALYLPGFAPWNGSTLPGQLPQWNILQWDGMAEFYPWRLYAARSMAGGRIPLWDPYVLCGTPFLANSQSAPLYPLHVVYYLPLGASTAVRMGWLAFIHLSLAGVFTHLLARDFGARPWAAAVGGAAFELSGFAVAWLELPSFLSAGCWIPLVLLCVARAVRARSWAWTFGAAAAGGMMLLGGHLQISFYGLLAAGCFWLWEAVDRWRSGGAPALRLAVGQAAVFLGLAFVLAMPQVLPALELSRLSHRAGPPSTAGYESYVSLAMPVQNWITLLVPDFYGLPSRGDFWGMWKYGPPNVMEYAGHVGLTAFVLVGVALVFGKRVTRRIWLLVILAAIAFLLAAGSPLCRLFYFCVPGFAQSGSPARALVLFCLAQALLAAIGLEYVIRRAEWSPWHGFGAWFPGLGIALGTLAGGWSAAAGTLGPGAGPQGTMQAPVSQLAILLLALLAVGLLLWLFREKHRGWTVPVVGAGALLAASAELCLFGQMYFQVAPPALAYPDTVLPSVLGRLNGRVATVNPQEWTIYPQPEALLPPNASLAYGWRDVQGYDSLLLGHYHHLLDAYYPDVPGGASPPVNGNILLIKKPLPALLSMLGARYVVSPDALSLPGLTPFGGDRSGIYENHAALPEAYLVDHWEVAGEGRAIDRLRSLTLAQLGQTAVIAHGPSSASSTRGVASLPNVERLAPGWVRVTANPAVPSLLVLLEGYTPGWKAYLRPDRGPAQPVPVLRTNVAFQSVALRPGPVTVEWRYQPASFRVGLFLGLTALLALGAAATFALTRRRRS